MLAVWDEVDLRAPELEGRLTGDSLYFDLDREQGRLVGAPSLRRAGADGDTLSLAAGVLRFELARRRLEGTGKFALRAEGVALAAARGVYEADSARVLAADGVVLHHRRAGHLVRARVLAARVRQQFCGHESGWPGCLHRLGARAAAFYAAIWLFAGFSASAKA